MLKFALICMFVATAILAVSSCFVKKNKTISFLLQTLSLIALVSLGIVAANYKNNFSGYAAFLILATLPQFLSLFDLGEFLKTKKIPQENNKILEEKSFVEENPKNEATEQKKTQKHHFLNSDGSLVKNISLAITAICIGFAGFYLGLETAYGFLIGLAIAFALTFLALILKKTTNPYDILSNFLIFLAVGFLIGQSLIVLLYSFSIINLLFCAGALIYCGFVAMTAFLKSNFDHLMFFIAMLCLVTTLIII